MSTTPWCSSGSGEPSLVLINENEVPRKSSDDVKLPFVELSGEKIKKVTHCKDYFIAATNFRLFVCLNDAFFNIPLYLVDYAEIRDIVVLCIYCKDAKTFKVTFESPEFCTDWYYQLLSLTVAPERLDDLFAYTYMKSLTQDLGSVRPVSPTSGRDFSEAYSFLPELKRVRFNTEDIWRVTEVNSKFDVCSSYPKLHIAPKWVSDQDICASANFRSMGRFPSVVWRNKRNGAVLARSSQPEVGLLGWRSEEDEFLLTAIAQASSLDKEGTSKKMTSSATELSYGGKPLLIIDARSYTAAVANRAKGGGCECNEYYPHCDIQFMGMANIHGIRKSMQSLRNLCSQGIDQSNWFSMLEGTKWLHYLSALLRSTLHLVQALDKEEQSVLVHCSDGWDRTTQLVALAELLLDPYYRTIQGFQVLVEREWLEFGHKFGDRCGHSTDRDSNERCPVFLQWLDCIHQIARQFPTAFEFNEGFLVKLAQHAYSCLFGTFLCNNLKEKLEARLRARTMSVWTLLNPTRKELRNFLYIPTDKVLYPQAQVRCLAVWERVYLSKMTPLHDVSCTLEETTNCLSDSGRFTFDSCSATSAMMTRDFKENSGNSTFLSSVDSSEKLLNGEGNSGTSEESSGGGDDSCDDLDSVKERSSPFCTEISASQDSLIKDDASGMNSSTTSSTQTVLAKEDEADTSEELPHTPTASSVAVLKVIDHSDSNDLSENRHSKSEPNLPRMADKVVMKEAIDIEAELTVHRTKSYSDSLSVSSFEFRTTSKPETNSLPVSLKYVSNFLYLDGLSRPCNTVEQRLFQLDLNHKMDLFRLQKKLETEHQERLLALNQNQDIVPANKDIERPDDVLSLPDSLNGERASVSSISNEEGWEQVQYEDAQPTRWIPDHVVTHCANCDAQFRTIVRKHHCRKCGLVFCSACSDRAVPVPEEQLFDPVRVCVNCFETLAEF